MENTTVVPQKTKNGKLPYDPAIPLLDIYPEKLKARFQTDICTPMFLAALDMMTKMRK